MRKALAVIMVMVISSFLFAVSPALAAGSPTSSPAGMAGEIPISVGVSRPPISTDIKSVEIQNDRLIVLVVVRNLTARQLVNVRFAEATRVVSARRQSGSGSDWLPPGEAGTWAVVVSLRDDDWGDVNISLRVRWMLMPPDCTLTGCG